MPKGKSITIKYKDFKKLNSKGRFEFLKLFVKYAKTCNTKTLCDLFHEETGYSDNYATEVITMLKPILTELKRKNFDVEYIRIPFSSLAEFFNPKPLKPKPRKQTLTI